MGSELKEEIDNHNAYDQGSMADVHTAEVSQQVLKKYKNKYQGVSLKRFSSGNPYEYGQNKGIVPEGKEFIIISAPKPELIGHFWGTVAKELR